MVIPRQSFVLLRQSQDRAAAFARVITDVDTVAELRRVLKTREITPYLWVIRTMRGEGNVPCGRWKAMRGSASSRAPDLADAIKQAGSRRGVFRLHGFCREVFLHMIRTRASARTGPARGNCGV